MSSGEDLVAKGDLAGAAAAFERAEAWARAASLYEQIWDFAAALRVAARGGDLPRALRNALRLGDPLALRELRGKIESATTAQQRLCAQVAEERGADSLAAGLWTLAGEHRRAADLYSQAGLLDEAAQQVLKAGDKKAAIELFRRHLQATPNDERAAYALGRLLGSLGAYDEAIPLLQRAHQRSGDLQAGVATVAALAQVGYAIAAQRALERLQRTHPNAPTTIAACAAATGFVQQSGGRILAARYRLAELLGSGGMGRVYRAEDLLTEQNVAVKLFVPPGGPQARDAYNRFLREARIAGTLDHPHIVKLIDSNQDHGFLVFEMMEGGTLAARLRPRISQHEARRTFLQVLDGLSVAHQHGVIHRDIKPANVFYDAGGAAKLGDFGVAHLQDSGQTQTGSYIGTLAFMSPEQIRGRQVSFATDLYALGVSLYVCLTGHPPFPSGDIVDQILDEKPIPPSQRQSDLTEEWDALLLRCLEKDPQRRPQSAADLAQELRRLTLGNETPLTFSQPTAETGGATPSGQTKRYQPTRTLRCDQGLQAHLAHDNALGREVILVSWQHELLTEGWLRKIRALALGSETLQCLLSCDLVERQLVFERVQGRPLPAQKSASRSDREQLAAQLLRALHPLHTEGLAHGAIAAEHVILGNSAGAPRLLVVDAVFSATDAPIEADICAIGKLCGLAQLTTREAATQLLAAQDAQRDASSQLTDEAVRALTDQLSRDAPADAQEVIAQTLRAIARERRR
ncbi:MAG: protein kinase [Deltaproteobacteria bacterium]|nr:protein kinase [Deltaproteobacteria bacterium]